MRDLRNEPDVTWKDFPSVCVNGDRGATNDPKTWNKAALLRLEYHDRDDSFQAVTRLRAGWANRHGLQLLNSGEEDGGFSTYVADDEVNPLYGLFAMQVGNEDVVFFAFAVGDDLLSEIDDPYYSLKLIGVVSIDDPQYADIPLI
jgi:hypothetical protein